MAGGEEEGLDVCLGPGGVCEDVLAVKEGEGVNGRKDVVVPISLLETNSKRGYTYKSLIFVLTQLFAAPPFSTPTVRAFTRFTISALTVG